MEPTPQNELPSEAEYFPHTKELEIQKLKETLKGTEARVIPIGDSGYIIQIDTQKIIAEAPWILTDYDDTGAKTSEDKRECKRRLGEIGVLPDVIKYCDTEARVNFGEKGKIYEPELDKRFLTIALTEIKNGNLDLNVIQEKIDSAREQMLSSKDIQSFDVDVDIENIYKETRYTSTLYPDTISTLKSIKAIGGVADANLAVFTYGDPQFQLEKVLPLIQGELVNQVWLTKTQKGMFLEDLVKEGPFKDIEMDYAYPETPRGVGIDFAKWNIHVILFDDDPKQIANFNQSSTKLELENLSVFRVRRNNVKTTSTETIPQTSVGEIQMSDTILDTGLFTEALVEIYVRTVEKQVVENIKRAGNLNNIYQKDLDLIQLVGGFRGEGIIDTQNRLAQKAGISLL